MRLRCSKGLNRRLPLLLFLHIRRTMPLLATCFTAPTPGTGGRPMLHGLQRTCAATLPLTALLLNSGGTRHGRHLEQASGMTGTAPCLVLLLCWPACPACLCQQQQGTGWRPSCWQSGRTSTPSAPLHPTAQCATLQRAWRGTANGELCATQAT